MLKFKYNYLLNTLAYHSETMEENIWHELDETRTFQGNFGSQGFTLDNGWMSFTLYENKTRAFYKDLTIPGWPSYYRKDLPKECPVIFTFTEQDQVEKIHGKWQKKGGGK
jgi:hypothetical protein